MAAPVAESKMAPVPESKTTPVSEPETPPAPHSDAAPLQEHSALDRRVGQSTAVVMPLLELGAIGYATWVFIYLICVQYLINPSLELRRDHNVQPRRATGIALIVVYAILLLLLLIHFMRLLLLIWTKPDLVPLGDDSIEKKDASVEWLGEYDAYICDYDGMPRWCHKCHNWKPDRTHHCKELGRCVRRMDHYCPWAGGIIAETTHKSFVQFTFYGALYTLCIWLVVAIFLADRSPKVSLILEVAESIQHHSSQNVACWGFCRFIIPEANRM
jgi:palmitoyltransferase